MPRANSTCRGAISSGSSSSEGYEGPAHRWSQFTHLLTPACSVCLCIRICSSFREESQSCDWGLVYDCKPADMRWLPVSSCAESAAGLTMNSNCSSLGCALSHCLASRTCPLLVTRGCGEVTTIVLLLPQSCHGKEESTSSPPSTSQAFP